MRINDELLDKLGGYFVYHQINERYGITFEIFVDRWTRGHVEIWYYIIKTIKCTHLFDVNKIIYFHSPILLVIIVYIIVIIITF